MKLTRPLFITAFTFALTASVCLAEKGTDLKPLSTKPGKVLFEDNFDGSALNKPWQVMKGDWQVKDGAATGKEKKEENHSGVLFLDVPNHNSIMRCSFQLAGGKQLSLSYNTAKGHHLFRVNVSSDGFKISKDHDKKVAGSKNEELASASGKIELGQWHTIMIEVQGAKVTVQTDTGLKAEASNAAIDADKTGYRFTTGGTVMLGSVKVWAVE